MTTAIATGPGQGRFGEVLREWRRRRRMSQLDLALEASVSARHLSFVETGRSRPSRELVLHLADRLEVPLRERNALLLAAGFAPVYSETPLGAPEMASVRDAIDRLLAGHEPFPAVIVDRQWELVAANRPAQALLTDGCAPELVAPPANTLRISLHPDGLAPRIVNLAEYSAHLLHRLRREATLTADPALVALYEELRAYPGVDDGTAHPEGGDPLPYIPLRLRVGDRVLTLFSTIATFGTALDVTVAEQALRSRSGRARTCPGRTGTATTSSG